MGSDHLVFGSPTAEHNFLRRNEYASENELEIRLENLDKLVYSVHAALRQVSFSGKSSALNLMNELSEKIKATHNKLRIAKLLSEPARGSMLSRVRDSLSELEEAIAAHLDVEMS